MGNIITKQLNKVDWWYNTMTMTREDWKKSFEVKYRNFSMSEKDAANGWGCCAIGCRLTEDHPEISTHGMSMQRLLTPRAYRLGQKFYDYVEDNNVEKAENVFNEIQSMKSILREEGKIYFPWDAYIPSLK